MMPGYLLALFEMPAPIDGRFVRRASPLGGFEFTEADEQRIAKAEARMAAWQRYRAKERAERGSP